VPDGPWAGGRDRSLSWRLRSIPDPDLEATAAVQAAVIAELRAANATLAAVNAEQARLIATLQARVAELERRLAKDASNSSKPSSSDGLRKPARAERRADEQTTRRRPGKQPGAPGAHLAQVAQPDQVVWHAPDRCGGCDADLAGAPIVGVEARQVFDLPQLRLGVAEHRAQRRRCACGTTTAACGTRTRLSMGADRVLVPRPRVPAQDLAVLLRQLRAERGGQRHSKRYPIDPFVHL
jgi:hypothetical protein